MKKILSLVLALALLCACVPAFADPYEKGSSVAGTNYDTEEIVPGATYVVENFPIPFTPTSAMVYKVNTGNVVLDSQAGTLTAGAVAGTWTVEIPTGFDTDDTKNDIEQKYVVEYTDGNGNYYYVNYYINAQGNGTVLGTLDAYYQGHANAFGPKVDGSWKTYAVVDLSLQGVQTCKLIASGGWELGTVSVTVNGDKVVVDYLMTEDINTRDVHDELFVKGEYLNIFGDAAAIDMGAESTFEFGKAISIANDLGGDKVVCVVVDLEVAYNVSSPFVTRFWPNMRENKNIVEAMDALLAQ